MFSLQDRYAPNSICFGCGPTNTKGLHVKSVVDGDNVVCHWHPEKHHQAFPGILCGGIIGAIMDCHCNWAGAWFLRKEEEPESLPCTVTAEYTVKLLKPSPIDQMLTLVAKCSKKEGNKVWVQANLEYDGQIYASCEGVFVAVKPEHPAYNRW